MPTYKTPDVYIEEISVFPPSVAEVETAIPAFIGYTEKATRLSGNDLRNVPTKVKSLLEFETYFGKNPEINLTEVRIDESNNFISASFTNSYYLYDSLRLFFDNGGGVCYIVSVGDYSDTVDHNTLVEGIKQLKKFDEPTMLLFPDAAGLTATQLGAVQQQALMQCGELGDRVCILDTRSDDPNGIELRQHIGINNLKYGAAYTPWLKINYAKNVSYADVQGVIRKGGVTVALDTLTSDSNIQRTIANLNNALGDINTVRTAIAPVLSGAISLNARYGVLLTTYQNGKTATNLQNLFQFLFQLADIVEAMLNATTGIKGTELRQDIQDAIANTLHDAFSDLIANEKELDASSPDAYVAQWDQAPNPAAVEWNNIFTTASPAASDIIPAAATTLAAQGDALLPNINTNFTLINGVINGFVSSVANYVSTYEKNLYDTYPIFQTLIRGINDTLTTIPPSGAIAGIYALVDNQRGVWKAPANVSLAGVIEPTYNFELSETDALNVDVNAGKSINAIRAFAAKGTLVWGARTLAGNDNEWRYISVRRFFNMVEESIKKSTYWAVFEPNDANTWVKVRGMIENYLIQKWREGALAGAAPKDAFFVKCGLGTTMTAQDILEGRMNVEIGMAVVRPAEFIILKFSHKLQTS
ncbi:phage tail sheath family protein [Pantanalinema sp. GBBB05]|uniref:phage tail sheath family protein n=1 Tax=Pantanalinema sp. GBBB05 TaxID=2604139 RepID=UPI001D3854FF|nr:phage tail sheath family protein [Pantanalinema sp. GBBB05]